MWKGAHELVLQWGDTGFLGGEAGKTSRGELSFTWNSWNAWRSASMVPSGVSQELMGKNSWADQHDCYCSKTSSGRSIYGLLQTTERSLTFAGSGPNRAH